MDQKDLNNLRERFNQLPERIQDLLMSDEVADLINDEVQLNYLPPEKGQEIAKLIGDVLLGYLSYKDFTLTFIDRLGINPIVSKNIAQKIESHIFFPIKEDLEKIYKRFSFLQSTTEPIIEPEAEEVPPKIKPAPFEIEKTIKRPTLPETSQAVPTTMISAEKPTVEEAPAKRSFLSFFRFKKPSQLETQTSEKPEKSEKEVVIIGKESEFKPVLEEKSPWIISFEDVKPLKEKVISEVEIKPPEEKIKETLPFEPLQTPSPIQVAPSETKEVVSPEAPKAQPLQKAEIPLPQPSEVNLKQTDLKPEFNPPQPIKIVDYPSKEEAAPTPSMPLEEKTAIPAERQEIKISEEKIPREELKTEPAEKIEKPKEKSEIPPENIIDLRKLKF